MPVDGFADLSELSDKLLVQTGGVFILWTVAKLELENLDSKPDNSRGSLFCLLCIGGFLGVQGFIAIRVFVNS